MEPLNQRQGFLVSAIVHLTLLMILISHPPSPRLLDTLQGESSDKTAKVFLPPAEVLKRMAPTPRQAPRPAPPPPTPAPTDPKLKDRISIGPPVDVRQKGPLVLRKEDDLTAVPKGQPDAVPTPAPAPAAQAREAGGAPEVPGSSGLRLPPGLLEGLQRGNDGSKGRPGPPGPSIASSLKSLDQRLARDARLGLPTGTGQNLAGLFFDPQGADFTSWVNHFKNEVYRNWIMPPSVLMGFRGHVDIVFVVERNGTISDLRIEKSSGTPALDKAAQNALEGSRFLPLPSDFGPPRVTMQVGFYYNEGPQGS